MIRNATRHKFDTVKDCVHLLREVKANVNGTKRTSLAPDKITSTKPVQVLQQTSATSAQLKLLTDRMQKMEEKLDQLSMTSARVEPQAGEEGPLPIALTAAAVKRETFTVAAVGIKPITMTTVVKVTLTNI